MPSLAFQLKAKTLIRMRGYRYALATGWFRNLRSLESHLALTKLSIPNGSVEKIVFGSSSPRIEIIVRQFLLQHFSGPPLRAIIFSSHCSGLSPIAAPLPFPWQQTLVNFGLRVSRLNSSLLWYLYVLIYFLKGLYTVFSIFFDSLLSPARPSHGSPYSYFHGLTITNLLPTSTPDHCFDILTWYSLWPQRDPLIHQLTHNIPSSYEFNIRGLVVKPLKYSHFQLSGLRSICIFLVWSLQAIFLSALSFFIGRWWVPLLLAEAVRSKAIALVPKNSLAKDYLFHFSRSIYRPLWTYQVEQRGSRVICYFYSTYVQPTLNGRLETQHYEYGPLTWPLLLVWDSYHASRLTKYLQPGSSVSVVGPITLSDPHIDDLNLPQRSIAVFDIQPYRLSSVTGISTSYEYFYSHPLLHFRFLEDLYSAISHCGYVMVIKSKRDVGKNLDKKYKSLIQSLSRYDNVVVAPSNYSAPRLLQSCIGSVSAPFTSAAVCSFHQGVPCAYYDPSGTLSVSDPAAHGLPLIQSKHHLISWLQSLSHQC